MGTWAIHIRIAEKILRKGYDLHEEGFLIGNIGPDCGVINEEGTNFIPTMEVSHWSTSGKRDIDPEKFFKEHLEQNIDDKKERSFYIGYYAHLLCDIAWRNDIKSRMEYDENYFPLKTDRSFINELRNEWYILDRSYFEGNKDSLFWTRFQHIESFTDYLEFYPEGSIINQIKYITKFYCKPDQDLNREYKYLTPTQMDEFIDDVVELIDRKLKEKKLVCKR